MIDRRTFIAQSAGVAGAIALVRNAWPLGRSAPIPIAVYKSSSCECCAKWVEHLRTSGFTPTVHDESDMTAIKDQMGVPRAVRSCHTAVVDKYLIEGHVPSADIKRVLAERPKITGLAVPGMPSTTPGMAAPGVPEGPYDVLAFTTTGSTSLFAHH